MTPNLSPEKPLPGMDNSENNAETLLKLRQLSGDFVHELATPLICINGAVDILQKCLPPLLDVYQAALAQGAVENPGPAHGLDKVQPTLQRIIDAAARTEQSCKTFWDEVQRLVPVTGQTSPPTALAPAATHPTSAPSPRRYQILLADDEIINQEVLTELLEDFNCQVTTASNGLEALALMEHSSFDMVLMDCRMPLMSGFEATQRIREQEQNTQKRTTPIIGLTASPLAEDREKGMQSGMDDFAVKPLQTFQINDLIARYIRFRKA